MTDLEAIKARIANGVYGDDRLTGAEVFDALAALDALVAEVEALRAQVQELTALGVSLHKAADAGAQAERAAVVAWLRRRTALRHYADCIERGEHREEKP
ncbi:hypothetical protein [Janthinobacterium sp.]|uniref:hypothetical protein n=1 Tax=Janthinobacterium sp. TaxID=1871054 RepID=UPI0025C534A9|nr:hypothetical protein [Janthinobacterium sp.]NBV20264.1 hypothetical protein [Janthinobacterium sp.]